MRSALHIFLFAALLAMINLFLSGCSESTSNECSYFDKASKETKYFSCPSTRLCAAEQQVCLPEGSKCGNGQIDEKYVKVVQDEDGNEKEIIVIEECDDGNVEDNDGCSSKCKREFCGDGIKNGEEVCDHGLGENSAKDGVDCSADCKSNLLCGNDLLDGDEACDHGALVGTGYIEQMIVYKESLLTASEENKEGIQGQIDILEEQIKVYVEKNASRECSPDCSSTVKCNDGVLDNYSYLGDEKEICDVVDGNSIFDTERIELYKGEDDGSGKIELKLIDKDSEEYQDALKKARCFDAEDNKGEKIVECRDYQLCGDARVNGDEECDPGYIGGSSTNCTKDCKLAACGDGIKSGVEECDHGLGTDKKTIENLSEEELKALRESGCKIDCTLNVCGDRFAGRNTNGVDEQCDDGYVGSSVCTGECTYSECGDGINNQMAGEQCDNENDLVCTPPGHIHPGTGDVWECKVNSCGDGIRGEKEECDYNEKQYLSGGDNEGKCTSQCKWNVCGDGLVGVHKDGTKEGCDNGTTAGGNVETFECRKDCQLSICGDGYTSIMRGEECDSGGQDTLSCVGNTCKNSFCGDGYKNVEAGETCDEGKNNVSNIPFMKDVLAPFCANLRPDANPSPFGDEKYSFCVKDDSGTWGVSLALDSDTPEQKRKRRAAAEYYYTQTVVGNVVLNGKCSMEGTAYGAADQCQAISCGNGKIDVGEVCDTTGNLDALTGDPFKDGSECMEGCRSTGICGNGIPDEDETCDPPIEGCIECVGGETCGNGKIESGEKCDEDLLSSKNNTGYCVISRDEKLNKDTWTWVRYNELELSDSDIKYEDIDSCMRADYVWHDGKCYASRNCIEQGMHKKCMHKIVDICDNSVEGGKNLLDCYDDAVEPVILSNDEFLCDTDAGYELVDVCIYNRCNLASCGDSYVFSENGAEACDHAQGEQIKQGDLEKSLTETSPCVGRCQESCGELCNTQGKEAECIACKMTFVQVYDDEGNPIYDDEGKPKYCNYNCKANECGDGIQNELAGEACDWGKSNNATECPNGAVSCTICTDKCQLTTIGCGNGIIDSAFGENCDYKAEGYAGNDATFCDTYDGGYPCKVCENNCKNDKEYNKIEVQIEGNGTVISNDERINCFSSGAEISGDYSANDSGSCSIYYTNNSGGIVFSAIPSLGWKIDKIGDNDASVWSFTGNCTNKDLGEQLKCEFPTERGQAATALRVTFKPQVYMVSLSADEGGCLINLSEGCTPTSSEDDCIRAATCSGTHTAEISVTAALRPETQNEYTFVKWVNGCEAGEAANICSNVIGTGWSNKAEFAKLYKVEYFSADEGMGYVSSTITSGTPVISGTEVTLLAVPSENKYEFSGWELSDGYTCTTNPCTVTINENDLVAVASFKEADLTMTVEARYINGINAGAQESPMPSGLISLSYSKQGGAESETVNSDEPFSVIFSETYTISYEWTDDAANDENLYRFALWSGCTPSEDNSSCTISSITENNHRVKLIFYKSKFNLHFAFDGLKAGETLVFKCNGTQEVCSGLFEHNQEVNLVLDTTQSVCIRDTTFVLSAEGANSSTYTCDCAGGNNSPRRYTTCRLLENGIEATESSTDSITFAVTMNSDKIVKVSLTDANKFHLSSASEGRLKEQMHGSILGKVGEQVAFYCQTDDCSAPIEVALGADVTLTAMPATGYELTAWRVQISDETAKYYHGANQDGYTIDLESGTFSFEMSTKIDVTPVFMPTLTVTASPADSATFTCTVSGCDTSNSTTCVLSPISDESLYNGYSQSIACTSSSEDSCTTDCDGAFSSEALISIEASSSGVLKSWDGISCSTNECKDISISSPLSVVYNSSAVTGSLPLDESSILSSEELLNILYHKVEFDVNGYRDWGRTKYKVSYNSSGIGSTGWDSGNYYLISVPLSNSDKDVSLICPLHLYRCVSEESGLGLTFEQDNFNSEEAARTAAVNDLKAKFSTEKCSSQDAQYAQCLFEYTGSDSGDVVVIKYEDKTKVLTFECTNEQLTLTGSWTNSAEQTNAMSPVCKGTQQVPQNADVTLEVSGIPEGYQIESWVLNSEGSSTQKCDAVPTCGFKMPEADATIQINVSLKAHSLKTQAYPNGSGSGTFECGDYTSEGCVNYEECAGSYEHSSPICVKAVPAGNYEFLKDMNGTGCPSGEWTDDGVCENIVMDADQIVSAVFSTQPMVSFNSNQEGCSIECAGCPPDQQSPVSVPSGHGVTFTARIECGDYELLDTHNSRTCSVNSNGSWSGFNGTDTKDATCTLSSVTSSMNYVYAVYTEKPTLTMSHRCDSEVNGNCALINHTSPSTYPEQDKYKTKTPVNVTASLVEGDNDYEFLLENNESTCLGSSWSKGTSHADSDSSWTSANCSGLLASDKSSVEARFTKKPTLTLYASAGGSFIDCDNNATITDGETLELTGSQHTICAQANAGYKFSEDYSICPSKWNLGNDGIAKCENVTMNGDQKVFASFVLDGQMSVSLKTINGGAWECATGTAENFDCSANALAYSSDDCSLALSQGATLCVKAIADDGFEFDSTNSNCPVEWNDGICTIKNNGDSSNETVLAVFKAMPTVTLVPTTAGTFIDCESGSNLEPGTTPYPSTTSQVQVCVKPNEGYELQGADGCPGTGWTAVENATDERLVGAYECEITSLSANPVVYATFSAVEAPVTKTSPVALTKIGDGELLCAEEIDKSNGTCPSEDSAYSKECENYVTENKALCIKAFGAEGDVFRPETIFDQPNSRCAGDEWPESGVCKIDYIEKNTPQSVVAYFVERYALNISVSETEQYDQTTLVQVAEATCANANSFTGFSESGSSYANGTSLCIKAMMHDKTNNTSLNIDSSSGCLWIPQTGTDGQPYYLCDVEMTSNKIITLTATEWPEVSISADVSIPSDNIDITGDYCTNDDNAVTQKCALGTQVTLETGRFWEHNALNVDQSVCPGSSWNISYENAICEFTMIAGASVNLVYDSGSSEPGEEGENPDAGTSEGDEDAGEETDAGNNSEEATDAGEELEDAGTSEGDEDAGEETDAGNNSEEATDAGEELEDAGTSEGDEDAGEETDAGNNSEEATDAGDEHLSTS